MPKPSFAIFLLSLAFLFATAPHAVANEARRAHVVFSIAQDGSLRWVKVIKLSAQFDEQPSIDAIKESAPFRPLPPEYGDHAEFLVKYDYWCTHRHAFSIQQVRESKGAFIPVGQALDTCRPYSNSTRFRRF